MIERRACIKPAVFFNRINIRFLRLQYGHDIVISMKIYLDNCCYNRPFDDQTALKVHLETEDILEYAEKLAVNGIKKSCCSAHCAINAHCDYFLITARQLLSLLLPEIKIANPIQFIMLQYMRQKKNSKRTNRIRFSSFQE